MNEKPQTHRVRVPAFLNADYLIRQPSQKAARLFLLLHGYHQSGATIFRKLGGVLPEDAVVLSPNGPFPLPRRTEEGYKIGFSWYFYNPFTDEYFMDMEVGVAYLVALLKHLGLDSLPSTIIGFSQGGYLAPFLAQVLPSAKRVIGIASTFLVDEMKLPVSFRMDAIHGGLDDVVSPEGARKAHERLRESGVKGDFHRLAETGHRIDPEVVELVRQLCS